MPNRAAIITGASSGIGEAISRELAQHGWQLVLVARREDRLRTLAEELGAEYELCDVSKRDEVERLAQAVTGRHPQINLLVNNAGVGVGAPAGEHETRRIDLQLSVNLRAIFLFYREAMELLRAAGTEHRNALVVNTSSISGKSGQPWLSVYSATKAGVVGYTQAMNKELNGDGIKSVALCPGFVETAMTEFVREHVPAEDMIRVEDVAEAVRFVLRTSPNCVIPEIVFQRPGEAL